MSERPSVLCFCFQSRLLDRLDESNLIVACIIIISCCCCCTSDACTSKCLQSCDNEENIRNKSRVPCPNAKTLSINVSVGYCDQFIDRYSPIHPQSIRLKCNNNPVISFFFCTHCWLHIYLPAGW